MVTSLRSRIWRTPLYLHVLGHYARIINVLHLCLIAPPSCCTCFNPLCSLLFCRVVSVYFHCEAVFCVSCSSGFDPVFSCFDSAFGYFVRLLFLWFWSCFWLTMFLNSVLNLGYVDYLITIPTLTSASQSVALHNASPTMDASGNGGELLTATGWTSPAAHGI